MKRKTKLAILFSFVSFLFAGFASPLAFQKADSQIKPSQTLINEAKNDTRVVTNIKVGFFAFEGYHEIDENGHRSGYGYDVLQMIARYADITYSYVGYDKNWADMKSYLNLPATDENHIDLVTSASKISGYTFSSHDIGTKSTLFCVKAGNNSWASGDYNGMHVGLLSGSSGTNAKFDSFMKEGGYSYTSHEYNDVDDLAKYLQDGKDPDGNEIDAIVTSSLRKRTNEWVL